MRISELWKAGLAAGVSAMLLSTAAFAQNIATVNTVQIFGTIDPAKINDYTEYMAGVTKYAVGGSRPFFEFDVTLQQRH